MPIILLDAIQVRPLQQRMLDDDDSRVTVNEVVVNSATVASARSSEMHFGGMLFPETVDCCKCRRQLPLCNRCLFE